MDISPIDRLTASFPLSGADAQGNPTTITNVSVAFLPYRTSPTPATAWTPASYANGKVTVALAGPYADPTGALAVPSGGGYLWAKDVEGSNVQAIRVAFVSTSTVPTTAIPTTAVVGLAVVA